MKVLICVTGYPGSGKSVFASVGKEFNLKTFTMGDIVREETLKKYGVINRETLGKMAEELRNKFGEDAVAHLLAKKLVGEKDNVLIVDGVRSMREVDILKKIGSVILIAIIAKRMTRYQRLLKRKRHDDIMNFSDFIRRELREKNFGLDEVIDRSDYYIFNEDISLNEFKELSRKIYRIILEDVYEKERL